MSISMAAKGNSLVIREILHYTFLLLEFLQCLQVAHPFNFQLIILQLRVLPDASITAIQCIARLTQGKAYNTTQGSLPTQISYFRYPDTTALTVLPIAGLHQLLSEVGIISGACKDLNQPQRCFLAAVENGRGTVKRRVWTSKC